VRELIAKGAPGRQVDAAMARLEQSEARASKAESRAARRSLLQTEVARDRAGRKNAELQRLAKEAEMRLRLAETPIATFAYGRLRVTVKLDVPNVDAGFARQSLETIVRALRGHFDTVVGFTRATATGNDALTPKALDWLVNDLKDQLREAIRHGVVTVAVETT